MPEESLETLKGKCIIMWGKDGQGKSRMIENLIAPQFGNKIAWYDWHGDYAAHSVPGKIFQMHEAKEFVEFCAGKDKKGWLFVFDEANNFYSRNQANPFNIDRIKVRWILSQKGAHHCNNCIVFAYHALPQCPDDAVYFYDYGILFDQEAPYNKVKECWNNTKIWDAYLMHQTMYNEDSEKIKKDNGELIKPPLIFSRTKDLPKMEAA